MSLVDLFNRERPQQPVRSLEEFIDPHNPRVGHSVTEVYDHFRSGIIHKWLQVGINDELAHSSATALYTITGNLPNFPLRVTTYAHFPDRREVESDLVYDPRTGSGNWVSYNSD